MNFFEEKSIFTFTLFCIVSHLNIDLLEENETSQSSMISANWTGTIRFSLDEQSVDFLVLFVVTKIIVKQIYTVAIVLSMLLLALKMHNYMQPMFQ